MPTTRVTQHLNARPSAVTYDKTGTGKATTHTDTYHRRFFELVPGERVAQAIEFESDDPAMRGEMRRAPGFVATRGE